MKGENFDYDRYDDWFAYASAGRVQDQSGLLLIEIYDTDLRFDVACATLKKSRPYPLASVFRFYGDKHNFAVFADRFAMAMMERGL